VIVRVAAPVLGLATWLLTLAAAACVADDGGPRLTSVAPSSAGHGAMVTLAGSRLCGPSADCTQVGVRVQFGLALPMIDAQVSTYSTTAATIVVPDAVPVGTTEIVVTVGDRSSNALDFTVTP
jgi:hypothetical protein